jgi:hypothetical protein
VDPVAAPSDGFDVCPKAGVVDPAGWLNGVEDPIAEGAPKAGFAGWPNGVALAGCEGWPKVAAGVVEPNAGLPKEVAGVVDPNGDAPNLGPEGVEGAPKVAAAGLLNGLLAPPGVGIFEDDVVLGVAVDASEADDKLFGVTRPGYFLPSTIDRFQTTQYADKIP